LLINNISVDDPGEISNAFNTYFCSIGPSLVDKLPSAFGSFKDYISPSVVNSIFVDPVTSNELEQVIDNLKNNKSCGPDGITGQLIK